MSATSSRLLKSVLVIARGTVLGQAPFVLITPLITRMCSPAELGIYGLSFAFVGMTAPAVGLRLELAVISAREEFDARCLLILSALAIVPVTGISIGVLALLKVAGIGSYDSLSWWLVALTGLTIVASGIYSSLRSWRVRQHRFAIVSYAVTLQGWARAAIPLALVPVALNALTLLGGELLSRTGAVALMLSRGDVTRGLHAMRVPLADLKLRLRRFWKYPVLLGPSALIDAATIALPVPILASHYGLAVAGKFALVQRLVTLPSALIGSSVGDVLHAHASALAARESENVQGFLSATAGRLLLLGLIVYAPIALVAPFVSGWIFGAGWSDAGIMITLLAPLCICQTVVNPISRGLLLSGREERKLLADVACIVLPLAALAAAGSRSPFTSIGCYSVAAVVANVFYYLIIQGAMKRPAQSRGSRPPGDR